MKFLYLAESNIEAQLIKHKLEQQNIKSYISGGNLHIAIGELPTIELYVKMYVDNNDYEDALVFIKDYKKKIEEQLNTNWSCSECNETSPYSISTCWNCGFERL